MTTIVAVTEIDLTKFSEAGLRITQRYWHRRLHARGGDFLTLPMKLKAQEMLPKIEAELTRRGLEVEDPQPAA